MPGWPSRLWTGWCRASGRWHRVGGGVFAHNAEIRQLMVHPGARGLGLGRLLVGALVTDAGEHDLEHLTLEVRGNNAGAMRLYESSGSSSRACCRTMWPSGTSAGTASSSTSSCRCRTAW